MTRVQTTIRLPEELMERLQREAGQMGISVNALMVTLIDKGIQDLQE